MLSGKHFVSPLLKEQIHLLYLSDRPHVFLTIKSLYYVCVCIHRWACVRECISFNNSATAEVPEGWYLAVRYRFRYYPVSKYEWCNVFCKWYKSGNTFLFDISVVSYEPHWRGISANSWWLAENGLLLTSTGPMSACYQMFTRTTHRFQACIVYRMISLKTNTLHFLLMNLPDFTVLSLVVLYWPGRTTDNWSESGLIGQISPKWSHLAPLFIF